MWPFLQGMEIIEKPVPQVVDWDAHAYAKGNLQQEKVSLVMLAESGIDLYAKKFLDVGCGTGNISKKLLALGALEVLGVDASPAMIAYAKEHYEQTTSNLEFKQSLIEQFETDKKYDCAVSFNCLHWVKDKPEAFKKISKSLAHKGEFLGNILSRSNPQSLGRVVLAQVLTDLKQKDERFAHIAIPSSFTTEFPDDSEIKAMISDAGLSLISYKTHMFEMLFKDRKEAELRYRPMAYINPRLQSLTQEAKEIFLQEYVTSLLSQSTHNSDGTYTVPLGYCAIIHAVKQ
jgi:2-polyprenyl-3-methyl-5-hydroxy-6-metoxy-1,4-benzoquinol methylase